MGFRSLPLPSAITQFSGFQPELQPELYLAKQFRFGKSSARAQRLYSSGCHQQHDRTDLKVILASEWLIRDWTTVRGAPFSMSSDATPMAYSVEATVRVTYCRASSLTACQDNNIPAGRSSRLLIPQSVSKVAATGAHGPRFWFV